MGKRQVAYGPFGDQEPKVEVDEKTSEVQVQGSEVQGSEVQGSGRTIFHWLKIIVDVIDDELQVSDARKCVGKKVDNGARAGRVVSGVVNKLLVAQEKLGISLINGIIDAL
jgi:hypothetical protein